MFFLDRFSPCGRLTLAEVQGLRDLEPPALHKPNSKEPGSSALVLCLHKPSIYSVTFSQELGTKGIFFKGN